jgi:hypothetical protein
MAESGDQGRTRAVSKIADHALGGWVEDKGNKFIDSALDKAWGRISAGLLGAGALSFKEWLAQHWVDAVRMTVLSGLGTYALLRGLSAIRGLWKTNRQILRFLEADQPTSQAILTGAVAPSSQGVARASKIATTQGDVEAKAFGMPQSIVIQCINEHGKPRFRCTLTVVFYGLSEPVDISPTQLRLSLVNSGPELARLDADIGHTCPGIVNYTGEGDWSVLMAGVENAMQPWRYGTSPWRVWPPEYELQCDIDISVPKGSVGFAHAKSGVKLWFELRDRVNDIRRVRIRPWSSLEQPPESQTLL